MFRLGDYEFFSGRERGGETSERRQICGAVPPTYLLDIASDGSARRQSYATRALADGSFCGHGEPAFSIFVLDRPHLLWQVAILKSTTIEGTVLRRVVTKAMIPNSPWYILYSTDWCPLGLPGIELPRHLAIADVDEYEYTSELHSQHGVEVAVGFEYPSECESANEVSWIAIAIGRPEDGRAHVIFDSEVM